MQQNELKIKKKKSETPLNPVSDSYTCIVDTGRMKMSCDLNISLCVLGSIRGMLHNVDFKPK